MVRPSKPMHNKHTVWQLQIKEQALEHVDEIWGSEVNLHMPQMYAGTTDLVGQYKGQPA